ncbi:MAG: recombination protein NinB, partial [Acidobacteriaceae bacterium]
APLDPLHEVVIRPYQARRDNAVNAALHAILTDISEQVEWHGVKLSVVVWKRLCMASWLRERGEQPQLIPALDGAGFDIVFERTSQLSQKQCAELVQWCECFGAEQGVKFKAPDYLQKVDNER